MYKKLLLLSILILPSFASASYGFTSINTSATPNTESTSRPFGVTVDVVSGNQYLILGTFQPSHSKSDLGCQNSFVTNNWALIAKVGSDASTTLRSIGCTPSASGNPRLSFHHVFTATSTGSAYFYIGWNNGKTEEGVTLAELTVLPLETISSGSSSSGSATTTLAEGTFDGIYLFFGMILFIGTMSFIIWVLRRRK